LLCTWGIPFNKVHPVEAQKSSHGSNPYIAILSLGNGGGRATEEPILYSPGGMCKLGNLLAGIDCEA
jgi:hypothetical protein